MHHRQLLSKESAAADLRLLQEKDPRNPRLTEFGLSPSRCEDQILFDLLGVASRDEIVKNRLSSKEAPAEEVPAEKAKKKVKSPSPKKKSTRKSTG